MKHSRLQSPLGKVRGLGSAHDGTGHFVGLRVTSLALVPLIIWFVFSVVQIATSSSPALLKAWLSSGVNATGLVLLLVAMFHHSRLGIQVVVEDYIHHEAIKLAALLANTFFNYGLAALSVISVLKLHFGH